jgi:hypothetical protein
MYRAPSSRDRECCTHVHDCSYNINRVNQTDNTCLAVLRPAERGLALGYTDAVHLLSTRPTTHGLSCLGKTVQHPPRSLRREHLGIHHDGFNSAGLVWRTRHAAKCAARRRPVHRHSLIRHDIEVGREQTRIPAKRAVGRVAFTSPWHEQWRGQGQGRQVGGSPVKVENLLYE